MLYLYLYLLGVSFFNIGVKGVWIVIVVDQVSEMEMLSFLSFVVSYIRMRHFAIVIWPLSKQKISFRE